jgi:hypothetical protein
VASTEELDRFLASWPNVDPRTGLHLVGDELLIKAREAMLFAVQAFNDPLARFKAEMFIVAAVIAWTYLLHAFFKREGVDRVYRKGGQPLLTPQGQPKHFELGHCLKLLRCPLSAGERRNLEYLLEIRHEIEQRCTSRIDEAIGAKLQACCLNFDAAIKRLFGGRYGLDRQPSLALQFARVGGAQRRALLGRADLPPAIEALNLAFEGRLSNDELNDPAYAYRVAIVPMTIGNPRKADEVFEIVERGSDAAERINLVLRDRERVKLRETDVLQRAAGAGFPGFTSHWHRKLAAKVGARDPAMGHGVDVFGRWLWYEPWVEVVVKHCEAEGDRFR